MMKKRTVSSKVVRLALLILLGVFAFVFSAAPSEAGEAFINIGTGTTGGTYHPAGAAMAKVWSSVIEGMKASVQSTGGTVQNIQLLADGEAEVGFADGLYYFAHEGKGLFDGKAQKNLRALLPLYPEPIHFLVAKDSGIKTIADLKGKRVSTGAVGSGTEATVKMLLRLAGLDPDKDLRCQPLGLADTASAMADKHIDAGLTVGAMGIAGVAEMAALGIVDFVDLPDDLIQKIQTELPYMNPLTIPANTYRGQEKEIKTFGSWNILIINEEVKEDLVYQMAKALFENKSDLTVVTPVLESMSTENLHYIQIPLHPGAERYFKEVGAIQ